MYFYRFLIVLFIVLIPLKCYPFVNKEITPEKELQGYINSVKEEMGTVTLKYENEISELNNSLNSLKDSRRISLSFDDKEEVAQAEGEEAKTGSSPEDLQKRIEELEKKLDETTKNYEAQITELTSTLQVLKKQQEELMEKYEIQQAIDAMETPVPEVTHDEPPRQTFQNANPEISLVGDILFSNVTAESNLEPANLTEHHHHDETEASSLYALHDHSSETESSINTNDLQLRELELAFQGVLDPYGRADAILGIHDGHLHIEEGYLTLLHLPGPLQARFGKFRLDFGQANKTHRAALEMVNYPTVVQNFLGETGLCSTGAELSVLMPTDTYVELSGAVLTGGGESPSFAEDDNYIYLGHIKTFFELNENHSLEVGGSYLTGKNDVQNKLNSQMEGFDITYLWQPTDDPYRSFLMRGEMLFSQRDLLDGGTLDSYGYYLLAQYQLSRRWYLGMRYDYSEFPYNDEEHENSYSTALSFKLSEATRFRLQYTHTDRTFGNSSDYIYLQTTFMLGPHKH